MRRLRGGLVCLFFAVLLLGCAAAAVDATVKVSGKVTFHDDVRDIDDQGSYTPAKGVRVDVCWGDGIVNVIWFSHTVSTDQDGKFSYSISDNPLIAYDIRIWVYAATPDGGAMGNITVRRMWHALYPYLAISEKEKKVHGGDKVEINLRIGGSKDNRWVFPFTGKEYAAPAFLVMDEVRRHYKRLQDIGLGPSDASDIFKGTSVIAPAAGVASYYNDISQFINLVFTTTNDMGPWINIDPGGTRIYGNYPYVLTVFRHETCHRIHDKLVKTLLKPLGVPAEHGIDGPSCANMPVDLPREWCETLAYTEGFAEFLTLVTVNKGQALNLTPFGHPSNAGDSIDLSTSYPPADHAAYEGEVAGLLCDLWDDDSNTPELIRHPALETEDGKRVPDPIIWWGQKWIDRIQDADLSRIKKVVAGEVPGLVFPGPVESIGQFLKKYRDLYPRDLHDMKAIAYSREITRSMPDEHRAHIRGDVEFYRLEGSDKLYMKFRVLERDREDVKYVKVEFWREPSATPGQGLDRIGVREEAFGEIKWSFAPNELADTDNLWVVVNDELWPVVYFFGTPGQMVLATASAMVTVPPLKVEGSTSQEEPPRSADPPSRDKDYEARVRIFNAVVEEIRLELQKYEERKTSARNRDCLLYHAARQCGLDSLPAQVPPELEYGGSPPRPSQAVTDFRRWLADIASGRRRPDDLPFVEVIELLAQQLPIVESEIREQKAAQARAPQLSQKLDAAFRTLDLGPGLDYMRQELAAGVEAFKQALNALATDAELIPKLEQQKAVMSILRPARR